MTATRSPVRDQRRAQILTAARTLFAARGTEATSMADIAAEVGVAEATVYKYFDSKHRLTLDMLADWYRGLFDDYQRDLDGIRDTRAALRLLIWRHLRTVRDYPDLCRLTFNEFRARRGYHGSPLQALNRQYTALLVDRLQAGMAAGDIRADLPATLLRDLIFGGIEHHVWPYLCGHGALDIDRVTDQLCSLLWQGLPPADAHDVVQQTRRLSALAERLEQRLSQPAQTHSDTGTHRPSPLMAALKADTHDE